MQRDGQGYEMRGADKKVASLTACYFQRIFSYYCYGSYATVLSDSVHTYANFWI